MKRYLLTVLLLILVWKPVVLGDGKRWLAQVSEPGGVMTGYNIFVNTDPEKDPYVLVDPEGRETQCNVIEYCKARGELSGMDRQQFLGN